MEHKDLNFQTNTETVLAYANVPEFSVPLPDGMVLVKDSKYAIGNPKAFVSKGFTNCSPFIFRSAEGSTFGLFHATPLPFIDLKDADYEALRPLEGGQVIEVKGTDSTPKFYILQSLKNKLGIEHAGTISLETRREGIAGRHFHIAFRPQSDELLVARDAQQDVITFPGFAARQ